MAREPLGGLLGRLLRTVSPSRTDEDDRELLRRFSLQRDEEAFRSLVQRHGPMVFAVCRRVLGDDHAAEDAFQATFIVLARKADATGWQTSISSWLYEVAYRCASKARVSSARRRHHEGQVPAMNPSESTPEADRDDLRALLDEELWQLPEKYRAPLVLCYLEGKSNEEAAKLLRCPVGTVYGRLNRARDLLRTRLARRQVVLTAAALATALSESTATAAVSASLVTLTVKAALLPTSETLAPPIASLVEGVLRTMLVTKLKTLTGVALGLAMLGGVASAYHFHNVTPEATAPAQDPNRETPKPIANPKPAEGTVKDGLSITLKPDRKTFPAEAVLSFTVTFKNESKEAVVLQDVDWGHSYRFRFFQGETPEDRSWITTIRENQERPAGSAVAATLEPGKTREVKITLSDALYSRDVKRGTPEALKQLPKGKYRVQVTRTFASDPNAAAKAKDWTGEITSLPVEIEIGDDPVKTVTKGGIKLTLSAEKVEFKPGEDILFKGKLENVAGKDLHWYRTNQNNMRFVHERSGDVWVTVASRLPPPPGAPPAYLTFKKGESVDFTAGITGKEKMVRQTDKLDDARVGLPTGRYRLEYSTSFMDHYPGSGKPTYEGKLELEPITFDIKAEDGK